MSESCSQVTGHARNFTAHLLSQTALSAVLPTMVEVHFSKKNLHQQIPSLTVKTKKR